MKSADGRFEFRNIDDAPVEPGTDAANVHRFAFGCRSRPDRMCSVNLRGRGHDMAKRSWTWDGDFNRPTLSPSINCESCWHGFIVAGVFLTQAKTPEPRQ